jgi:hypothetical protein
MSRTNIFALFIFGTIAVLALSHCAGDMKTETVHNCKVMNLQQQQLINGSKDNISTEIRYLVITDKETFICENSLLNGKFNNSDIFWRLKEGDTYNLKVCGVGKSIIFDYRNILEAQKIEKK